MMHLPASVRVYLCASACDMRKSFDGLHALVGRRWNWTRSADICSSSPTDGATDQDPVLGSRRVRGLGEAAGRRNLCDAVRRHCGKASRDYRG